MDSLFDSQLKAKLTKTSTGSLMSELNRAQTIFSNAELATFSRSKVIFCINKLRNWKKQLEPLSSVVSDFDLKGALVLFDGNGEDKGACGYDNNFSLKASVSDVFHDKVDYDERDLGIESAKFTGRDTGEQNEELISLDSQRTEMAHIQPRLGAKKEKIKRKHVK